MESTSFSMPEALAADVLGEHASSVGRDLARLSLGAGFAFVFGLAAGSAHPAFDLPVRALLLPLGAVASVLFALPSLGVLLALFGLELPVRTLLAAASRGVATSGLVLVGLAPLALLYATTSAPDGFATRGLVLLAFGVSSALGLRTTFGGLLETIRLRRNDDVVPPAFVVSAALFALLVNARIVLPALGLLLEGPLHAH